ncbi:MAG: TraB domain-containing protein [Nanoarchaeota archaeon]|nr:TraB domain-containing protein [Nanoarchaeota archaeon]
MRTFGNIHLLGTSHIAKQSMDEITKAVDKLNPDIIAIELDKSRLQALLSGQSKVSLKHLPAVGINGWLFAKLGSWASRKLGKAVGVDPGAEMKVAIQLGKERQKRIALIDQPIEITLKRFSSALTWKEKGNLVADIFKGRKETLDLSKVPEEEFISRILAEIKLRYPSIHKVLIEERNVYMADKLKKLTKLYPDSIILAIVGAGHVPGLSELL